MELKCSPHDYGTASYSKASEDGSPYVSWLDVRNIRPAPFSEMNPLRCVRPLEKRF